MGGGQGRVQGLIWGQAGISGGTDGMHTPNLALIRCVGLGQGLALGGRVGVGGHTGPWGTLEVRGL